MFDSSCVSPVRARTPLCGARRTTGLPWGRAPRIMETKLANAWFFDPPYTELPTCMAFSRLELRAEMFIAQADVDKAFHRLRLPAGFASFFPLPATGQARYLLAWIRESLSVCGPRSSRGRSSR